MTAQSEPEQQLQSRKEQDALYEIFSVIWPHDPDPVKCDLNDELSSLEKVLVQDAMRSVNNNKTKAASLLNISRENLIYKLKKIAE
mgnify:CR=1 FL=1